MPHGTQILFAAMCVVYALAKVRGRRRPSEEPGLIMKPTAAPELAAPLSDAFVLLAPPVLLLVVVSSQMAFNHHLRYVLPGFGFAFVFSGGIWLLGSGRPWFGRILIPACLAWTVLASVLNHPHNLAYFNELSGGPDNGDQHLLHSNLD